MNNIQKAIRKIMPSKILELHWKYFKSNIKRFENKTPDEVFTEIYKTRYWGDDESVSGVGSSLKETGNISNRLPQLLSEYNINSMLDIPCGDFYWMQHVNLNGVNYTGADIVQELIDANNRKYKNIGKTFLRLDLTTDVLPKVDLIFCRDCLIHLSEDKVLDALRNIKKSGSKYMLTTTYNETQVNKKITTGDWRPLNLEIAPFNLPKPLLYISDTQFNVAKDKHMALWQINELGEM